MSGPFKYDVFFSYAAADQSVVRHLVERLKAEGVRVWFDEWEIDAGHLIARRIEEGLETSRVLVLCMSQHAYKSEWVRKEIEIFRSDDPANRGRRFLPLRLDGADVPQWLRPFKYIEYCHGQAVEAITRRIGELNIDDWSGQVDGLLTMPGRSQRKVVYGALDLFLKLLEMQPFRADLARDGMLRFVDAIRRQRGDYELLEQLHEEIGRWFDARPDSPAKLVEQVNRYRCTLGVVLQDLAAHGADALATDDVLLLYAYSDSVHYSIMRWLTDHPSERLQLTFCQCLWKIARGDDPFQEATEWANKVKAANASITFITDAGAGEQLRDGHIRKVLFGAYKWGRHSARRVWFANTPGTLQLAATAHRYHIPILVIAEQRKHESEPLVSLSHADFRQPERPRPVSRTESGLPIGFHDNGEDVVDSKDIPFMLITEQGELACADFDLRKSNRVILDEDHLSVSKYTLDSASAQAERTALQVLSRQGLQCKPPFRVPSIIPRGQEWTRVRMRRRLGVRVHDFIATINELLLHGRADSERGVAEDLKRHLMEWALNSVMIWQSDTIQLPLRRALGKAVLSYDYASKCVEAARSLCSSPGTETPELAAALQELRELGDRLSRGADICFRDATLKNQILDIPALFEGEPAARGAGYQDFPFADRQWFDLDIVYDVLCRIPEKISLERIRNNIWHVDFELASSLTTRVDDFVHVLALEVLGLTYDEITARITGLLPVERCAHVHETILLRCFRGWARRLAYRRERPDIFATRYRHESLEHYHRLALAAAGQLRDQGAGSLCQFLQYAGADGSRL